MTAVILPELTASDNAGREYFTSPAARSTTQGARP